MRSWRQVPYGGMPFLGRRLPPGIFGPVLLCSHVWHGRDAFCRRWHLDWTNGFAFIISFRKFASIFSHLWPPGFSSSGGGCFPISPFSQSRDSSMESAVFSEYQVSPQCKIFVHSSKRVQRPLSLCPHIQFNIHFPERRALCSYGDISLAIRRQCDGFGICGSREESYSIS